jgi:hypothetical protein
MNTSIPSDAVCLFESGGKWFAVCTDFINRQESPHAFDETPLGAAVKLLAKIGRDTAPFRVEIELALVVEKKQNENMGLLEAKLREAEKDVRRLDHVISGAQLKAGLVNEQGEMTLGYMWIITALHGDLRLLLDQAIEFHKKDGQPT